MLRAQVRDGTSHRVIDVFDDSRPPDIVGLQSLALYRASEVNASCHCVAISPDNKLVATATSNKEILVFEPESGKRLGGADVLAQPISQRHNGIVVALRFSRDAKFLFSAALDGTVARWSCDHSDKKGFVLKLTTPSVIQCQYITSRAARCACFYDSGASEKRDADDGSSLAVAFGCDDRCVHLCHILDGAPIGQPLSGHNHTVTALAVAPRTHLIASASGEQQTTIIVHDVDTQLPVVSRPLVGHTDWISALAWNPATGDALVSCGVDGRLLMWSLDSSAGERGVKVFDGAKMAWLAVAFSSCGRYLLTGGHGSACVALWSVADCKIIGDPLRVHARSCEGVCFAPENSAFAASVSSDGSLCWFKVLMHERNLVVSFEMESEVVSTELLEDQSAMTVTAKSEAADDASAAVVGKRTLPLSSCSACLSLCTRHDVLRAQLDEQTSLRIATERRLDEVAEHYERLAEPLRDRIAALEAGAKRSEKLRSEKLHSDMEALHRAFAELGVENSKLKNALSESVERQQWGLSAAVVDDAIKAATPENRSPENRSPEHRSPRAGDVSA